MRRSKFAPYIRLALVLFALCLAVPAFTQDAPAVGWLGIDPTPVDPATAQANGMANAVGAVARTVHAGSPAALAGLRSGDIIEGFAGQAVTSPNTLVQAIEQTPPGTKVFVALLRDGGTMGFDVTLGWRRGNVAGTVGGPQDSAAAVGSQPNQLQPAPQPATANADNSDSQPANSAMPSADAQVDSSVAEQQAVPAPEPVPIAAPVGPPGFDPLAFLWAGIAWLFRNAMIAVLAGSALILAAKIARHEPSTSTAAHPAADPGAAATTARGNLVADLRTGRNNRYRFSFERMSGSWRAYIVAQPSYGNRPSGAHETHRLSDAGRRYVCWSAAVPTLSAMREIARMWAERTDEYIATGRGFG